MSSGAIGMLETRGMASLMASTDAMLKAAEVQLCGRHGIGSGWLTAVIAGQVADVEAAIRVGEVEANRTGELIGAQVVPRPDARAMDAMPHVTGLGAEQVQPQAIGLLETQGLTPLVAGADAMLKAAQAELGGWAFIGGALCHAPIFGDVAAVQTALEVGRQAAERIGTVYATLVLPQPSAGLGPLLPPAPAVEPRSTGALGLIETIGYASVVGSADAMLKAADVQIERLSIGSGGRIAALATGHLDDVQAAVCAGAEAATALGELNASAVVSRPDPALVARFATAAEGLGAGARQAMGLIETRSTVALVRAVDRMLKAAAVEYEGAYKVGYYLTAAVVRGDVGAVQVAIDAGREEAVEHGELVSAYAIPQPYSGLEGRLPHV
ncbi:MAG: BMC domain-containing protein [Gemmatimonadetes bacterium]|nr:BMC domain-containing protein [Gemmatimonadota bacterium]MXY80674.1 BMC domain-containing protein [Gemmatimonadota bacterium]MYB68179.1 BMC domain-containing protein [Gemmatimonadota bacterium]